MWRCVVDRWWSVAVAVLVGAYTLVVTVLVSRPDVDLGWLLWFVVVSGLVFLFAVFVFVYALVKLNLLACKV